MIRDRATLGQREESPPPPKKVLKKLLVYIGINFSNFFSINYIFRPLTIPLILLKVMLQSQNFFTIFL